MDTFSKNYNAKQQNYNAKQITVQRQKQKHYQRKSDENPIEP